MMEFGVSKSELVVSVDRLPKSWSEDVVSAINYSKDIVGVKTQLNLLNNDDQLSKALT